MKPPVSERLDEILGIEDSTELTTAGTEPRVPAPLISSGNQDQDMVDDFGVVRSTLHNLIEKGNELVDNANFFAKEKQDARSVEAAAMAQKEARDNALALITVHKTRKEIEQLSAPVNSGDMNITQNAVFVGTASDLLRMTKEMDADGLLNQALKTITIEPEESAAK